MAETLEELSHTKYTAKEESVGNASLINLFVMAQSQDMWGNVFDDPEAEWILTNLTASLTISGTIQLFKVDPDGVATAITPAYPVPSSGGLSIPLVKVRGGLKGDIAYSTTGGGNSAVQCTGYLKRPGQSKPATEEFFE